MKKKLTSILLTAALAANAFTGAAAPGSPAEAPLTVDTLKVDDTVNPLGTDNPTPKFSWQLKSTRNGVLQQTYRIGVASSPEKLQSGNYDVWDSGEVSTDRAVDVAYNGKALETATRYYWNVTVTDNAGNTAVSQETAYWETGLLKPEDWQGSWIRCAESREPDNYTIDFDLTILKENAGFLFAAYNTDNCLMWQFGVKEHGAFYLRPHVWCGGDVKVIADVPIPESVVPLSEALNRAHHVTIQVEKDVITTYLDQVQIDRRKYGAAKFGKIGFRQFRNESLDEQAVYDNIVVKSDTEQILFSDDFSGGENRQFDAGTVTADGGLLVQNALVLQNTQTLGAAPMFRKVFTADREIRSARLYATALGLYEAELNGQKVGDDFFNPGWTAYELNQDDQNYVQYQTFDVTSLIDRGENVLGATTGHGWYSGKLFVTGNNRFGAASKFRCQLVIGYADGTRETIATDESWQTSANGPILRDDFQLGETYDATREMSGWSTTAFSPDESWRAATAYTYDGDLVAQVGPTVKAIREFTPKRVNKLSNGSYIIDIGQNIAGFARLNKVVGDAGVQVKIRYGEMCNADGTLYTENLRSATSTDFYTLKGNPNGETWQPRFTFHGFRYIEITNYPGELTADSVTAVALSSLQQTTGTFETSNELVNQLQSNITWGQRDNFISVPTDCPQRDERLGYTGDGQIFIRTAALNMNVSQFFKKYMRDVSTNQRADGAIADWTPNYVPDDSPWSWSGTFGTSGWGDAVVIIPWSIYMAYGSTDIIRDNYAAMKKWVARYQSMGGSRLIVDSCTYGDWLSDNANTPTDVISTGYFAYCADLLSKMADAIGETEDAQTYRDLFLRVRDAFNREFIDAEAHVKGRTQTAYLLALKFDLYKTQADREKGAQYLVSDIKARNWHLSTGFIGVSYLCPMLSEMGYSNVAYKLLMQESYPSWLYSVVNGATTIWERWNSYTTDGGFGDVGMNSFNHYSLGSVGEWFYNYVAGIRYDEENPAYKHFTLAPNVDGSLRYVKVSFDSVYGKIVSNWNYDKAGKKATFEISVPANTTADVLLPSDSAEAITVNGGATADGIRFVEYRDGLAVYEAGSGDYTFETTLSQNLEINISSDVDATVSVNGGEPESLPLLLSCRPDSEIRLTPTVTNDVDYAFQGWSGDYTSEQPEAVFSAQTDMDIRLEVKTISGENLARGKTATASSTITNNEAGWNLRNLTDGKLSSTGESSGYTSNNFTSAQARVWVQIDLGKDTVFDRVHLYPRTNAFAADGSTCSFPKDFSIQIRKDGASAYTTVAQYTDYAAPYKKPAVLDLEEPVSARYVRLSVTRLGAPPSGELYYLQLAELGVYRVRTDAPAEDEPQNPTPKPPTPQDPTVRVQSVKPSKSALKLKVGKRAALGASCQPANATNKTLVWSVDDPRIVTYANGKVTAKRAGVTYATVKSADGGASACVKITVSPGKPTAVKLKKGKKKITVRFKAAKGTTRYQISIKPPKGKAKVKTISKTVFTLKKPKKGKYTVRVRGYWKSGKTVLQSAYTAKKSIRF